MTSGKDIIVPCKAQAEKAAAVHLKSYYDRSDADNRATFDRLFALKRSFGRKPNRDVLAIALIAACIKERMNQSHRIEGAMKILGFKPNHTVGILNRYTGEDVVHHLWWIDTDGAFCLHKPSP